MKVYWCNGSVRFTPESDADEAALEVRVCDVLPVFSRMLRCASIMMSIGRRFMLGLCPQEERPGLLHKISGEGGLPSNFRDYDTISHSDEIVEPVEYFDFVQGGGGYKPQRSLCPFGSHFFEFSGDSCASASS